MPHRGTLGDIRAKGHSYRGHAPDDVLAIVNNPDLDNADRENLQQAQDALAFIEGGRFGPWLEAVSEFFFRLDADEAEAFTRRNPDTVEWMSAYNAAHELNPYTEYRDLARQSLGPDREAASNPPRFDPVTLSDGALLNDMTHRRRSYRNWSPLEFAEIAARDSVMVTAGAAAGLGMGDAQWREETEFPIDVGGEYVASHLFDRIEAGRFAPVLETVLRMFARLDPDERRSFARRNPGQVVYASERGNTVSMIHHEQLFPRTPDYYGEIASRVLPR